MGQQQQQQQRKQIIFDDDDEDKVNGSGTSFEAVADHTRRRSLHEESGSQRKYLAFSLNNSSNCDYNNR